MAGYVGLAAFWTVLQRGPADRLSGLAGDATGLISRLFDPTVAGIPNRHDSTEPSGGPMDAPASRCPPGYIPAVDPDNGRLKCVPDPNAAPPATGGSRREGGGGGGTAGRARPSPGFRMTVGEVR